MNSKIEVRTEAVRLALNVEGVGPENVIEVSEKITAFILGDTELPEQNGPSDMMNKLAEALSGRTGTVSNTNASHEKADNETGEEA
ncbi:MAG: hypothetical protein K1V99_03015 [Bacteroidales bacterium]